MRQNPGQSITFEGVSGLTDVDQFVMADITVEPAANVQSATGGQVVSRSALLQNVWLGKIDPDEVLTHVISQIRKTCKALDPGANYVEMVAKSGCRLAQSVV